ncbi:MAG TPA: lysophospholipid acyltransferase family protein [Thermoanaerobaculia bacterium]|nr:lysophospholipid acyltransferase family protein [Thermoanaerobaculia bacterium]
MRTSPSAVFDDGALQQARRPRRRGSPLRHRLEYALFRLGTGVLFLFPSDWASRIGRAAARLAIRVVPRRRQILLDNLKHAFPEKDAAEVERLALESVEGLGAAFFEFLEVSRWTADDMRARVVPEAVHHLEAARARGKGVIALSAHFGNWEFAALAGGLIGETISSVARPLDNPLLEAEVSRRRTRFGNRIIAKRDALREMLRAMQRNETVAIMIDQNVMAEEATFVPFFGRPAATTASVALLQRKTDAAVVPVFAWPAGEGRYRLVFEKPILAEEFADEGVGRAEQVRLATIRYTEVTEAVIRQRPEAWLWLHNRWKTQPTSP